MIAHTIVWDSLGLSRNLTGIERLVVTYCQAMVERDAEVRQVLLAHDDSDWLDAIPKSVVLSLVRRRPLSLLTATSMAPGIMSGAAHYHSWGHRVSSRHHYARSSFSVQDWGPYFDRTMSRKSRYIWRTAMSASIRNVDFVHITNRSLLTDTHSEKLSTCKVVVSGLPRRNYSPEFTREVGPGQFILFVGSADPRKRVDDLVAAATHPKWPLPLVLAGNGTERYRGRPNTRALGRVTDQELEDLYANANALALISTYEGFGLPLLEALRRGIPAMASAQVASIFPGNRDRIVVALSTDPESLSVAARAVSVLGRTTPADGEDDQLPLIDAILEPL